jgi:hypothetical protein
MIITLLFLFQTLLKETEAAENVCANAITDDHPKGAINAEVARIARENLMTSDGYCRSCSRCVDGWHRPSGESEVLF